MSYRLLVIFFLLWAGSAIVTGAVTLSSDPASASGSGSDFENFTNSVYNSEEIQVDRPVATGNNPVSSAISFGNAATGWASFLFKSAALYSPIWEGWATPIRYLILILQIPMILLVAFEGAKVLSGFIPFT